MDQGPFALIAEELKLEQGFLHVVFEQSPVRQTLDRSEAFATSLSTQNIPKGPDQL